MPTVFPHSVACHAGHHPVLLFVVASEDFNEQEIVLAVCHAAARHFAEAGGAALGGRRRPFAVALLHVHDEATLRLRSFREGLSTERSRKSSVQQHALWLFPDDNPGLPVFAELDALSDKTAPTLATSLDKVMRSVASVCQRGVDLVARPEDAEVWFVHVLVGDAVGTNVAAARMVLAKARGTLLAPGFFYFVMVVRCANHQANLVIGSVVEGQAALCGAFQTATVAGSQNAVTARVGLDSPQSAPHKLSCGALVRLYKYLVNDYYSEFFASLVAHVSTLQFQWEPDDVAVALAASADALAADLERLYGPGVVPQGLRASLNAGLDRLLFGRVEITHYRLHPTEVFLPLLCPLSVFRARGMAVVSVETLGATSSV